MQEAESYRKKILVSSMLGLGLEGMDILLLSFALSSIINEFHISSAAGGVLPSVTNIGMLVGGVIFGYWADKKGRIKIFTYTIFIFAIVDGVCTQHRGNIYIEVCGRFRCWW